MAATRKLGRGGQAAGRRAGPQLRKPGRRYTKKQLDTFLLEFAGSCNVRRSCEVAGIHFSGIYKLRRNDPAFAQAWAEALCEGYQRLELLMLESALASASGEIAARGEPAGEALRLTERSMLSMLTAHRQSVRDARAAAGAAAARDDADAARAELMAKLDEMHARLVGDENVEGAEAAAANGEAAGDAAV